ncbi:tetratricopeptide repeat protein [Xanthocytophaga agilis]|uniref:Tetratricopeptide repeat protein n=1 Tax=Xanthocytophaga agilis TaxID=3048010 RepID=A0AAE3QXZ3_9BACT|nr:tetratricopeptide repeat protein [Xanthocytophaga agilis]MDJ1500141.1 tetratricopeptide repeat protein [Xanthocytophaga agilis]
MKKVFLACLFQLTAVGVFAQAGAAYASLQSGKLDDAKTQIDKAITNEKQAAKANTWLYRGDIYAGIANSPLPNYAGLDTNALQIAYDSYKKAGELDAKKAEEANKKIADLQPIAMNMGSKKYQEDKFVAAAKYFDMARTLNAKDTVAALYAGVAYQRAENYAKARDAFEALINLGSNDPSIYNVVHSIYRTEKNNEKALEIVKKGLAKFPTNKELKQNEFNLYIEMGKSEEAKANLEQSLKSDPNNLEYLKNLGILYDQTGDKVKAQEYYEKALAVDPNNYDANFNLAVLHYNKGADLNKKVRDMDLKTYQKEGKKVETEMKGHFQKALPYFEKNFSLRKDDMQVLEPLKSIYTILERKADADKIDKVIQTIK